MITRILLFCFSISLIACTNDNTDEKVQTDNGVTTINVDDKPLKIEMPVITHAEVEGKTVENQTIIEDPKIKKPKSTPKSTTSTTDIKDVKPKQAEKSQPFELDIKSMPMPTATVKTSPKSETKPTEIVTAPAPPKKPAPKPELSHVVFEKLLNQFVSKRGTVDYKGLVGARLKLDAYIKTLQKNPVQANWSKSKKMAFWINAYNAFTIRLMINNYPISSITKLDNGKPWDRQWIELNGKMLSLNDIENKIIRPQFNDPRIHFAVNCAAKSCPPLWNHAWTAENLNNQLDIQTKKFINSDMNQISANSAKISNIFNWYAADFGNLVPFLNKYSDTKLDTNATIDYLEYDWSLNGM